MTIRSNLSQTPGGGADRHAMMGKMIGAAEARINAADRLHTMREAMGHQADLTAALDVVAGMEKTPREASRDGHGASVLERLVIVALDLLVRAETGAEPPPG